MICSSVRLLLLCLLSWSLALTVGARGRAGSRNVCPERRVGMLEKSDEKFRNSSAAAVPCCARM